VTCVHGDPDKVTYLLKTPVRYIGVPSGSLDVTPRARLPAMSTTGCGRACVKTRIKSFAVGPHISERIQTAAEHPIHLGPNPRRTHYTPKHASWLNMAEIEISIMERQCLGRRLMDQATTRHEVRAWQRQRNAARRGIDWTFTRQDADRRLSRHYSFVLNNHRLKPVGLS
jgi:hypothetical protein